MALTIKEIENAKPKDKKYKMLDGGGLSLLVLPTGTKLWLWRYQFNRSEKNMTFGEYPVVAPKKARDLHFAAKKLLATGINPMAERKAEAEAKQQEFRALEREADSSFEKIARKWWAWWSIGKSPRHAEILMNRLESDVFPVIGHLPIDGVQAGHIRDIMLAIEKRGASDVAKRAHQSIGQIFRFATVRELASRNPAADFMPRDILAAAKTENFARVDEKDLPELLAKMDEYNGDALTRFGLKLLAYCFPRTSELIEAPWIEFDLVQARWVIPPERMKMDTPHIVPLSHQAVAVLRALKLLTGNGELVLPGAMDKKKPMSNNTLLYALYRLGYRGRMTGHGFRGIASTILHENGFEEAHIELQLAHMKRDKVAAAYNHAKYLKPRAEMMQWWADYLDAQQAKGRLKLAA
ncbi:phage integrase central domain-containing protein [Granulicella mallensis]|jgi:integrase|uniref:Integrase n=1 Tax=Granulicella mallensis TaxID=940614 RepID=A0A7W7ZLH7_9BACT|nr:integrase arm-type DNA-binding domain-containing protein [Granulicella mallensis]MBB5061948.1 integrase [Granulicella mallensis]